jgi:drug/metabolite transporter (DMT)-like permease
MLGGEHFTMQTVGAMAVILAGVVVITLAKARGGRPVETPALATPSEPPA